jgi:hypothetical protein
MSEMRLSIIYMKIGQIKDALHYMYDNNSDILIVQSL